jgi:hypothetical protein
MNAAASIAIARRHMPAIRVRTLDRIVIVRANGRVASSDGSDECETAPQKPAAPFAYIEKTRT